MGIDYSSSEPSKEHGSFKNAEWGPEAVETMAEKIRAFPILSGSDKKLTMGDLINWTPKELISKVMLEEKVFETWHHGRAVLIGDGKQKTSDIENWMLYPTFSPILITCCPCLHFHRHCALFPTACHKVNKNNKGKKATTFWFALFISALCKYHASRLITLT